MNRSLIIALGLFTLGQALIWMQSNSQFISSWCKDHPIIMASMGWPISLILIYATKYVVEGFDGLLWPGRFIGFSTGMLVMALFTWFFLGEGINMKTAVTLLLALAISLIQIFWK